MHLKKLRGLSVLNSGYVRNGFHVHTEKSSSGMANEKLSTDISVVIITHNEEDNIGGCLESVKWADEIIVVDSESSDKTEEICARFGVTFYTERWRGFAQQKNSAIEKATKGWILSLDADERITPALHDEIVTALRSDNPKEGYFIARRNFFLGQWIRHCGWYPDYTLRLFKRGRGRFGMREVHESVEFDGRVGRLTCPMEHYTYTSLKGFMERLDRYSTLAAQELLKEQKRYGIHHILFRPPFTFINMYVVRAGFLDGYYGFVLSVLYAFYTFLKYIKLRELQDAKS